MQIKNLLDDSSVGTDPIPILIKIDVGYHRAGVVPGSKSLADLLQAVADSNHVKLAGLYAHMGNSYSSSSPTDALDFLAAELEGVADAASQALSTPASLRNSPSRLTLSVGATPTASSAQNLLRSSSREAERVKAILNDLTGSFHVELHAGVYPLLDMQQHATHARPSTALVNSEGMRESASAMTLNDLGLRILVEVLSLYPQRSVPEALIGAGTFALGREPCKSYQGWGVISPGFGGNNQTPQVAKSTFNEADQTGWIVGRISQEHGILTWQGPREKLWWPHVGDKLLVWPNHACVAGLGFDWYLVVDSDHGCRENTTIVDVWLRCRGW